MQIPETEGRDPSDTLEQPQPEHWLDSVDIKLDELSQRGPEGMDQTSFLKGLEDLGYRGVNHEAVAEYCRTAGLHVEYNEAGYRAPVLNGVLYVQEEYHVWGVLPDMAAVDLTLTQVLEGVLEKESTCIGGIIDVYPTTASWRVENAKIECAQPSMSPEKGIDYLDALLVESDRRDRC